MFIFCIIYEILIFISDFDTKIEIAFDEEYHPKWFYLIKFFEEDRSFTDGD